MIKGPPSELSICLLQGEIWSRQIDTSEKICRWKCALLINKMLKLHSKQIEAWHRWVLIIAPIEFYRGAGTICTESLGIPGTDCCTLSTFSSALGDLGGLFSDEKVTWCWFMSYKLWWLLTFSIAHIMHGTLTRNEL